MRFEDGASCPLGAIRSTSRPWLRSLANSLDLFTIWTIVLIATGFTALCGARKMPFRRSLWGVLAPWLVYVLGKMGFAALTG